MELTMRLFSPRWGHDDTYTLTHTKDGWIFAHGARPLVKALGREGKDKAGLPTLLGVMGNDAIYPPDVLDVALGHLWDAIDTNQVTQAQAQAALTDLADWINTCTHNKPKGFWSGVF